VSKNPVANIFNQTVAVELTTSFPNADYGDVKYFCKYGPEDGDLVRNSTSATLSNSIFTCNLFSEKIIILQVSIWMESFGTQRMIVRFGEQFRFIGKNSSFHFR
jgi:hypothetical protein